MAGVPREGLYILLAVGCGIGGYLAQRHFVDTEINQYKKQLTNKQELVCLKQRVGSGQVLSEVMLETVAVPAQFAHPRAVKKGEIKSVVGSPVKTPVEKGEVLLWNQMDMGASASVNDKISEGEKAVTIPVNTVTGSGGLLRPNMRIDVYGVFPVPPPTVTSATGEVIRQEATKQDVVATRLLENVVVVAVGSEAGMDYGSGAGRAEKATYNTVTLLVKEKQVERVLLGLALSNGGAGLYCVLRSEMDARIQESAPRTLPAREFLESFNPREQKN